MSRIGNLPIQIPDKVNINIDKNNNVVTVKGPKGELAQKINKCISLKKENGQIKFERISESKQHKSMHGLFRSLVNNMVVGVSKGYKLEQELVGVGFRAKTSGQILELNVGYSHPIHFMIPDEVKVSVETKRKGNPKIILESCDKQLIGQVAAKIRSFKKPEPYKGKGIRFVGEEIKRKAGKSASA